MIQFNLLRQSQKGGLLMFTFTNDCLIGVETIDQEHQMLFQLIADTNTSLHSQNGSISDAIALLEKLKEYAVSHFAHEEAYMQKINDPELARQQKEHAAFTDKINSYNMSNLSEDSVRATMLELLEYLARWLVGHILGSDILIGQFSTNTSKLAIPVFTEEYKTGIELVDAEHKVLFDIIAKIHATIEAELLHDKYDEIMKIIDELRDYTKVHFADEEAYMESIDYDGLEKQKLLHQNFIDKMMELDYDHIDDNQDAYLYDFLGFLQNWLVNHILKVDKLIPSK